MTGAEERPEDRDSVRADVIPPIKERLELLRKFRLGSSS